MKLWICLWGLILVFSSCRKASEEVPSYLRSSSATVRAKLGDSNSAIYGLSISIEGDDRGTWQYPFLMPHLGEGLKSTVLRPVVKQNNLSTQLVAYPMYKIAVQKLNYKRGLANTVDSNFVFEYDDAAQEILYESMEVNTRFSSSKRSDTARSGLYSMAIYSSFSSLDSETTSFYSQLVPMNPSKETYLEFDYYMPDGILAPCLSYESNGNTFRAFSTNFLLKNEGWVHVYWHLTPTIVGRGQTAYTPTFVLTPSQGSTQARVYIDNLKIVEK
jgi:hypothetical protein